jgi:hypothetical protein
MDHDITKSLNPFKSSKLDYFLANFDNHNTYRIRSAHYPIL